MERKKGKGREGLGEGWEKAGEGGGEAARRGEGRGRQGRVGERTRGRRRGGGGKEGMGWLITPLDGCWICCFPKSYQSVRSRGRLCMISLWPCLSERA